ncbi:hypothetical protein Mapa_014378 [Marchantia paleacea]|nr:hypothetical protein Mapa_014378 [Marchantia paleacea]
MHFDVSQMNTTDSVRRPRARVSVIYAPAPTCTRVHDCQREIPCSKGDRQVTLICEFRLDGVFIITSKHPPIPDMTAKPYDTSDMCPQL